MSIMKSQILTFVDSPKTQKSIHCTVRAVLWQRRFSSGGNL